MEENTYLSQEDIIFLGTLLQQTKSKNVLSAYAKILIESRKKGVKDAPQKVLHNEELEITKTSMATFSVAGSTLLSQGFISIENIPNQQRDYFRLNNDQKQAALFGMAAVKDGIFNLQQVNQILSKWSKEYEKTQCQIPNYLVQNRFIEQHTLQTVYAKLGNIEEGLGRVSIQQGILQIGASIPKNFGRYKIEEEIARGGMGIVYKAYDPSFQRIVALKVLIRGEGSSQLDVARFEREARSVYKIQHENIIPIYDLGSENGMPYFSMHFVEGKSLDKQKLPVSYRQAIKLITPIANALHSAHQTGIIHRDIKPANIMIDNAGKVWLTDFGLAKDRTGVQELTQAGSFMGTPTYMAPEQIDYPEAADAKCDIYSLGVVFYLLIVGKPPYEANTFPALLRKIAEGKAKPPHTVGKDIPENISRICMRAIAKKKKDRYGSAERFVKDLEAAVQNKSSRKAAHRGKKARKKVRKKNSGIPPATIISIIVACVVILLFVIIAFSNNSNSENNNNKINESISEKIREENEFEKRILKKVDEGKETEENILKKKKVLSKDELKENLKQIDEAIQQSRYAKARELLTLIEEDYSENAEMNYQKSRLFTVQKNYIAALEHINKSVKKSNSPRYLGQKGLIYVQINQPEKAIVEYTKSIDIGNCLHCRDKRATLYFGQRQYQNALDDFTVLLRDKPKREYFSYIGQCFGLLGQAKKAIQFFSDYIKNHPNNGNAYYERAMVFDLARKDFKKARKDYKKAIKLLPGYVDLPGRLARTYLKAKNYIKAVAICQQMKQKAPRYFEGYEILGDCYAGTGELDLAKKEWNLALEKLSKYPPPINPQAIREFQRRIKSKLK